jgi:hypothetical protein
MLEFEADPDIDPDFDFGSSGPSRSSVLKYLKTDEDFIGSRTLFRIRGPAAGEAYCAATASVPIEIAIGIEIGIVFGVSVDREGLFKGGRTASSLVVRSPIYA